MGQPCIISDGTAHGTYIYDENGKRIQLATSLSIRVVLHLNLVEADVSYMELDEEASSDTIKVLKLNEWGDPVTRYKHLTNVALGAAVALDAVEAK